MTTAAPSLPKAASTSHRIKMVMTRGKDDEKALYDLLGNKDDRKKFDTQFKKAESNFKIAIVMDMWLTGFDVPFLDTIYIGIKKQMNLALTHYAKADSSNIEEIKLPNTKYHP